MLLREIRRRGGAGRGRPAPCDLALSGADHDEPDLAPGRRNSGRATRSARSGRYWHLAAPCPPWLKQEWIDWLGGDAIWELYAGTEAQASTVISGTEWLAPPRSVGRVANRPDEDPRRRGAANCRPRDRRDLYAPGRGHARDLPLCRRRGAAHRRVGNRSAISAGSTPTAISTWPTGAAT
ncbi:MAG: hypothetical protein WDN69_31675 [Aliidongia sp.]